MAGPTASAPRKGIEALKGFANLRSRLLGRRGGLAKYEPDLRPGLADFLAHAEHDASWRHVKDVPTHEVYQWFEHEVCGLRPLRSDSRG